MSKSEIDIISGVINDLSEKTINLSPRYYAPCRSQAGKGLSEQGRSVSNYFDDCTNVLTKYYQKVFGWLEANPSRPELADAIDSVCIFAPLEADDTNYLVNTAKGYNLLKKEIINTSNSPTYLIGEKGKGKTFIVNHFLNMNSKVLYEENKLIWYRIDASNFYEHIVSLLDTRSYIKDQYTLERYTNIHLAYITFNYSNGLGVFEDICDTDRSILINKIVDIYNKNIGIYTNAIPNPTHVCENFEKIIHDMYIKFSNNKKSNRQIHNLSINEILGNNNRYLCAEIISKAIREYIYERGYRLLFIVDGIDNIDYFKHFTLYKEMLNELAFSFIQNRNNFTNHSKVLVCLRPESANHLRHILTIRRETGIGVKKFRLKSINPSELLSKKLLVAKSPKGEYFFARKQIATKEIVDNFNEIKLDNENQTANDFITEFDTSLSLHISESAKEQIAAVKSLIPNGFFNYEIDEVKLLEILYNYNMRALINNTINVYKYKRLFEKKKSYLKRKRDYLTTEGMLLNGSMYLDSENDAFEYGKCIPNIFYFDRFAADGKWHGLTAIRILQLIISGFENQETIKKYLISNFKYNHEIIDRRISYLIGHGLISVEAKIDSDNKTSIIFNITEKGKLMMYLPFFDSNIFYYMAIDTPLSENSITDFKQVFVHGRFWDRYLEACIKSSITLLRHILTKNKQELEFIKNEDKHFFKLEEKYINSLKTQLCDQAAVLYKIDKDNRFVELKNDLEGII